MGSRSRTLVGLLLSLACMLDLGCSPRRRGGDDDDDADADGDAGADGCPQGWRRCDGSCVHILSSSLNCGGCGIICPAEQSCIGGECSLDCGNLESCDGECFDLDTSPAHCGDCAIACEEGQSCVLGTCQTAVDSDIRLVGGATAREGRVEILHAEQWGTICDDTWDVADAQVACRQLGLHGGVPYGSATYGAGVDPIWMDDTACVGTEASLDLCPFAGWAVHNCSHSEDSGVSCDP